MTRAAAPVLVGLACAAHACVLFRAAPVPCKTADDCPGGVACSDAGFCAADAVVDAGATGDPVVLAQDEFAHSVPDGFGSALVGGVWRCAGATGVYSVGAAVGSMTNPGTQNPEGVGCAVLDGTPALDVDVAVRVVNVANASEGERALAFIATRADIGSRHDYRLEASVGTSTTVVSLSQDVNDASRVAIGGGSGTATSLARPPFHLRFRVENTAPPSLMGKIWADGDVEPAAWTVSGADLFVPLNQPGAVEIGHEVHAVRSITTAWGDFVVRDATRFGADELLP